jgi:HPt (histidine-containing phosphotransfer) domain-containing protein
VNAIIRPHIFDEVGLLKRYLGNEALARELVLLFVAKAPGYISVIKECLEVGNHIGVQHQAHSLKGAAETLGADRLAALAAEIVALGKINELDKATQAVQQLVVEYETLVTILVERFWMT